ncbi:MAG: phosphoribosylformylglycinamidine synthase II, partial [Chloroflexia bacterium]|nr:phosphoribosylformylglycinamidine synthase II [Chloroflexia bacterium]
WELWSATIGRITGDGIVRIVERGEVHVDVPVSFFIDECPVYQVEGEEPVAIRAARERSLDDLKDVEAPDVSGVLLKMLESSALGSRRSIWEQYDHTIQTNTVLGPGRGDAAVIRIKGTRSAIAATMDCNSRYCFLDPYHGARLAVAEATRNVSCVGGKPLGLTNCLNFGNPERPPGNWQLREAVRGMGDAARALGVPIVSGNVSLYNESNGVPIQPTPMIGCAGVLDDVMAATAIQWNEGDFVVLLGGGVPSLGGSDYLEIMHGQVAGSLPALDLERERNVQELIRHLGGRGEFSGVHDVSNGGLAIALAELAMASGLGATIDVQPGGGRLDVGWFGESASRVVVAVPPTRLAAVEASAGDKGIDAVMLGRVGGDRLILGDAAPVPVEALVTASGQAFRGKRDHARI